MRFIYEKEGRYVCECESCGMQIKIKKPDIQINGDEGRVQEIECFCGEISNVIKGTPAEKKQEDNPVPVVVDSLVQSNVPRCPTCGSTNIERISLGAKAVGGYMFGIFSSNIRRTYKCNDCKYKW